MSALLTLPAALVIDRVIGDPGRLWSRVPHPVVWMGRLIGWLDVRLNRPELSFSKRRQRGVAALVLTIAVAGAAGALISALTSHLGAGVGLMAQALLASIVLSQKSLVDHVQAVARGLSADGLAGGRKAVAQIVGRDVSVLDEAGVARAAIESAAENFSDGTVAPAFWFALLGMPGLLVFKIINTADSMIGHRSPKYEAFGWAAARLDDLMNYVPARLSALLILFAAGLTGRNAGEAFRAAIGDADAHRSPNAGWPEAAAAGALGLALGGPRRYGPIEVDGAWLNPAGRRDASAADIAGSVRLIDAAWSILLFFAAAAALLAIWISR